MRKRSKTIADMAAKEAAYGKKLTTGRVITVIVPYIATFTAYTLFFYRSIWPTIVMALFTTMIGYKGIAKRVFDTRYYRRSLNLRHQFISDVTQIFGNGGNMTVLKALRLADKNLWGEFKQDIDRLISVIGENGHNVETRHAFDKIRKKYQDDIWFVTFMQQLQTANEGGAIDADAFSMTLRRDDDLFDEKHWYQSERTHQKNVVYLVSTAILGGMYAMTAMYGEGNYVRIYAHSFIGWGISAVYLFFLFLIFHQTYKYFFDESLTSVK